MTSVFRSASDYQLQFAPLNTANETVVGCKKADLYRCAVTVGNPAFISLQLIREYGLWPVLCDSILRKCNLISTNIEVFGPRLVRRRIFDHHISDEKRIVSYNVGMALAKFHSESLLGIRNLLHLECLRQQNAVVFVPQLGTRRPREPDLFGQAQDNSWHLFEAKGTSRESKLAEQINYGKIQAAQVLTVCGELPATRSVAATYFGRDRIYTKIKDPSDSGSVQIEFEERDFFRVYYSPFLLSEQRGLPDSSDQVIDGIPVRMFTLDGAGGTLHVGVLSTVYPMLQDSDFGGVAETLARTDDSYLERGGDLYSFGRDGFVIGFEPA